MAMVELNYAPSNTLSEDLIAKNNSTEGGGSLCVKVLNQLLRCTKCTFICHYAYSSNQLVRKSLIGRCGITFISWCQPQTRKYVGLGNCLLHTKPLLKGNKY